ncbi:MAG: type I-F CRISPR-associated endoribonuclease Cas6/Csy4 [Methylococcales bacterium]|jgi:CRISPR-associated endoribonuclease Cas6/Csy4 subtype I-F|nr:type I-F CRISPR-associated endoribonuclease Cas6/Csy4 [Methylococcales bacterium]
MKEQSHYIEILILVKDDIELVYTILHGIFHRHKEESGSQKIGISFPYYENDKGFVGHVFRLIGNETDLNKIKGMISNSSIKTMNNVKVKDNIVTIPDAVEHVSFYRYRADNYISKNKLKKQAEYIYNKAKEDGKEMTSAELISVVDEIKSNLIKTHNLKIHGDKNYYLAVRQQKDVNQKVGEFSVFGLSKKHEPVTVPLF